MRNIEERIIHSKDTHKLLEDIWWIILCKGNMIKDRLLKFSHGVKRAKNEDLKKKYIKNEIGHLSV